MDTWSRGEPGAFNNCSCKFHYLCVLALFSFTKVVICYLWSMDMVGMVLDVSRSDLSEFEAFKAISLASISILYFEHQVVIWTVPLDLNINFWLGIWSVWVTSLYFVLRPLWRKLTKISLKRSPGLSCCKWLLFRKWWCHWVLNIKNILVDYLIFCSEVPNEF